MDENKEFNNETVSEENLSDTEAEVTEAVEETAETVEETAEDAAETAENAVDEAVENIEDTPAFGDELAETEADVPAKTEEKKSIIMKPILIAAGIVIVVALAALVIRLFFNTGLDGTWHYVRQVPMLASDATSDEAVENVDVDYYFTFSGSEVKATIGTVTSKGTYELLKNDEGKSVMTMELTDLITSYNFLPYGEYEVNVSGNAFTGRKLTLTTSSDESATIEMTSASYSAPEIERENEFTPVEDIQGKWLFNQEGYDLSYEFRKDGTASYHEKVSQMNMYTGANMTIDYSIEGIYDVNDTSITMHFYYTKDSSMDITYQSDGDTLYINGFPFVREGTATAAEAE